MQIKKPNNGAKVTVAIMPWSGISTPNAAIVSKALAMSEVFTSIQTRQIFCPIGPKEMLTKDLPNIAEDESQKFEAMTDEKGIIRIGQKVFYGDILVGKGEETGKPETQEEKLIAAIFGNNTVISNTSLRMPFKDGGIVVDVVHFPREILISIAIKRTMAVGDVLKDKSGNEIVVADIVDSKTLPHIKGMWDQKHIDMVITGPSKTSTNITPVYEDGILSVVYSLETPGFILLNEKRDKPSKSKKWQCKDEDATVGTLELCKKELLKEEKMAGYGISERSGTNRQLTEGVRIKPSMISALLAKGLQINAEELLTIKSDSAQGYIRALESVVHGNPMVDTDVLINTKRLKSFLQSLGFSFEKVGDTSFITPMNDAQILELSFGEITEPELISYKKNTIVKDGLLDQAIFGPTKDYECQCGKYKRIRYKGVVCNKCGVVVEERSIRHERFGHIALAIPVIHPLYGNDIIEKYSGKLQELVDTDEKAADIHIFMKKAGDETSIADKQLMQIIPVLPAGLRPFYQSGFAAWVTSDLNDLYRRLIIRNKRIKRLMEIKAPAVVLVNEIGMLQQSVCDLFNGLRTMKGLSQHLAESVDMLYSKKVSYAGMSIAVPSVNHQVFEVGIPVSIALEIFRAHLYRELLLPKNRELYDIQTAKAARKLIEAKDPIALEALHSVSDKLYVLVADSVQKQVIVCRPVIATSDAVTLHPDALTALGIQMEKNRKVVLHVPLLPAAQIEASLKLFSPDKKDEVIIDPKTPVSSLVITTKDLSEILEGKRSMEFALSIMDHVILQNM